jgi:hypothetical protein
MTTTLTWRRPWLYPKQAQAIYDPARYVVIEASTKSGKTVGCLVWLIEQAMEGKPGQNFWWVAPSYGQAKIAYRRAKRGLSPDLYQSSDSELALALVNGAVLMFKTAEKPDNLYGEDVFAAVVDEATRCREEAWHAVRSTLTATRGRVRIIGNVKGRTNWAYRMARRAEKGTPGMAFYRIVSSDAVAAGILQADEIEDARRQLPEDIFRQLYEAEPADDEGNPFGAEAIRACIGPLSMETPTVWGWDLAKSEDWTVGIALDGGMRTCGFHRFQKPWEETFRFIETTSGYTKSLVDSTGVGDPIVERLKRAGGDYEAFVFTSQSKQKLMEGLAVAIQHREVTFPEGPITIELESFRYEYTRTGVRYSAPAGEHDDCVMALALAVKAGARPRVAAASLPTARVMDF